MVTGAAAVALLLLMTTSGGYAQLKNFRNRFGVRLTGGSGPKGRVELSSVNAWFNNYTNPEDIKPAWNTVCDEDFDDSLALIMCTQLGYSHGRKVYDPKINYKRNPRDEQPIGKISCKSRSPRKAASNRQLRGISTGTAEASHKLAMVDSGSVSRIRSRTLYMPLTGELNAPPRAPYSCEFANGFCNGKGPLAAVECSHTALPPAPSPPPSPPSPPPSPPSVSASINLVGGRPVDMPDSYPEANLACANDEDGLSCEGFGRVEVQVAAQNSSDGQQIWAPVCAIDDADLAYDVRNIACQQMMNWPDGRSGIVVLTVPENPVFLVPTEPASSPGDFDVSKYAGWVTILGVRPGAENDLPRSVQDLNYKVSAQPCETLFAVQCQVFGSS